MSAKYEFSGPVQLIAMEILKLAMSLEIIEL